MSSGYPKFILDSLVHRNVVTISTQPVTHANVTLRVAPHECNMNVIQPDTLTEVYGAVSRLWQSSVSATGIAVPLALPHYCNSDVHSVMSRYYIFLD